ncbi:hypothetical protein O3M35_005238 [Rhynocoris fuscipes]|uniref:Hcy-binding domain-containing protein n=1 Tax=Rhynocoris fuscipes TaxID=488301 RepID=A0AAW1DHZ5_9HEMI
MDSVILMEGSFGTQLEKYVGKVDGDPLWSAKFLVTEPEKCIAAHRDLVKAGTQILTTGSYQASIEGYAKYMRLDKNQALSAIKNSVKFAKEAIKREEKESGIKRCIKVAGSVGPYGAYLHDGSDYTGSYFNKITKQELIDWHRPRFEALIEEGVDLLGFETIPAMIEAEALITLLKEFPTQKAWISFSCKDNQSISSGESFYDTALKCWELGKEQLIAIGVNCLHPALVVQLFKEIRINHPEIPLIAYPNSGEHYDLNEGRWIDHSTRLPLTSYTKEWLDLGVKYIGGCCRTNDIDVKQFSKEIEKWKTSQEVR